MSTENDFASFEGISFQISWLRYLTSLSLQLALLKRSWISIPLTPLFERSKVNKGLPSPTDTNQDWLQPVSKQQSWLLRWPTSATAKLTFLWQNFENDENVDIFNFGMSWNRLERFSNLFPVPVPSVCPQIEIVTANDDNIELEDNIEEVLILLLWVSIGRYTGFSDKFLILE